MRAIFRSTILLALSAATLPAIHAQAFAAAAAPDAGTVAPRSTATYDVKAENRKKFADQVINTHIRQGIFTIDGLVAKLQLDYELTDASFLYFYVPGSGTAVVSRVKMPDAVEVKDAFHDNVLAFSAGGHDFRLENSSTLINKSPRTAWVRFDSEGVATQLGREPMMGFGTQPQAPYAWPGALADQHLATETGVKAPSLPASLLPRRISFAPASMPATSTR